MRSRVVSTALLMLTLLAGGLAPTLSRAASPVAGLHLLMIESRGCIYCRQWRAEILPSYASHAAGRAAPVLPIDIDGPWPDGLALARRPQITPTFILTRDGQELSRLEGYPGRTNFWPLIGRMLADSSAAVQTGTGK